MREIRVKKISLHRADLSNDLKGKTPHDLIGMMWQLTLNAWVFKENINAEPRLQRNVVVLKRGRG
jgi:hypothetical protein